MKRFLSILTLGFASLVSAATLSPIQLLNPAGSSSGQVISSTGPSSPPVWSGISVSVASGTLPITNGGTGATTQAAALTNILGASAVPVANGGTGATSASAGLSNLGGAALSGANFTGNINVTASSGSQIRATAASGVQKGVGFYTGATQRWFVQASAAAETGSNAGSNFNVARFDDTGTFIDNPLSITRSTGVASFVSRPTFAGNTPWDGGNLPSPAQTTGATFTGAITPSQTAGIVGTTTNNNANAGSVGEHSTSTSGTVALSNGVPANITSLSLGAGDWEVMGSIQFQPAGTTVTNSVSAGISSTSATLPAVPLYTQVNNQATGVNVGLIGPSQRFSLSGTTTIYLVANAGFTTSTMNAVGNIRARRVR